MSESPGDQPVDRAARPETPLVGRRIVSTRPTTVGQRDDELAGALESLGAEVLVLPTIRIEAPPDPVALEREVVRASGYDWLVFSSANAVERFAEAVRAAGMDSWPAGPRVCAVGPATAASVQRWGGSVEAMPDEYIAERVRDAIMSGGGGGVAGHRVLFPRAEEVRPVLAESLRDAGAEVVEVVAYRTVENPDHVPELRRRLAGGEADMITFASGSAVRSFARLVGAGALGRALVASIGPVTTGAARIAGIQVAVEATTYTAVGLAEAIGRYYGPSVTRGAR